MTRSVSIDGLRSYLVRYHSLDCYGRLSGEAGVKKYFKKTGSVQYDPLDVAGRNPDLALQSRIKGFSSEILDRLLYEKRFLIDGWDKEMCIYRTEDWPYFNRIRTRRDESYKNTLSRRGQTEILSYTEQAIREIKARGPLGAKDMDLGECKPGRWGHKKVSGAVLDYLFSIGELGIRKRNRAIRIYDAIENIVPGDILNSKEPFGENKDFLEWYFLRRIGSVGAHWLRNGAGWNGCFVGDGKLRAEIFKSLEKNGSIVKIKAPEINDDFYIRRKDAETLNEKPDYDNAVRFLAPLDNMLWDRLMVYKIFGFRYSWEVYAPAEKRKYGYYVLPVLYKNRLIARMEPEKRETGGPFRVKTGGGNLKRGLPAN